MYQDNLKTIRQHSLKTSPPKQELVPCSNCGELTEPDETNLCPDCFHRLEPIFTSRTYQDQMLKKLEEISEMVTIGASKGDVLYRLGELSSIIKFNY
jgi:hypothetical protein